MSDKRKLQPVRNNPGIYKVFTVKAGVCKDMGRFLATRRVIKGGLKLREKAMFTNIEDAKNFRAGRTEKLLNGKNLVHRVQPAKAVYPFRQLLSEWKDFHYLTLEEGTRLLYDRRLPGLSFLDELEVSQIDTQALDRLVKHWMSTLPQGTRRLSFEKELNILTVVLNFYRKRRNRSYILPIEKEHYEASIVRRRAKGEVQALTETDLIRFLEGLKSQKTPDYHPMACVQFGLSLRIGEACGLNWDSIDFERGEVRISQTIVWNDDTWEASVKPYPKNRFVRHLALPDFLKEVLQDWKRRSDVSIPLLFHKDGQPLCRKTVGNAYNRTLKQLKIFYVSGTHMMRKTSATHANEATGDFYAVSKQLDHSSPEVTQRYVKPVSSIKRKVASALNEVFRSSQQKAALVPNGPQVSEALENVF